MDKISPIAMPGTHESFFEYFKKQSFDKNLKILDVGAGHGAFTQRLFNLGYINMSACDLFPNIFEFDKVSCKKVDITKFFDYPDNSFDMAIAIEVSEHILDHEVFFKELSRIVKPQGQIYLSTPNILSLKSRLRFMFRGFYYSFDPLEMDNYNGLQHVASLTIDQYNYIAVKNGFSKAKYNIDRRQSTSKWILFFMFPLLWLNAKIKQKSLMHNELDLLLGRLLFLNFQNKK